MLVEFKYSNFYLENFQLRLERLCDLKTLSIFVIILYSFYLWLINDYCLIIDRRTQVLFFIFLLTLTSDGEEDYQYLLWKWFQSTEMKQYRERRTKCEIKYFHPKYFETVLVSGSWNANIQYNVIEYLLGIP